MRLTVRCDDAMRLLMYVAQHPARLCTISDVAQDYDIAGGAPDEYNASTGPGGPVARRRVRQRDELWSVFPPGLSRFGQ